MKKSLILWILILGGLFHLKGQQIEDIRIKTLDDKINILYNISQEKAGQLFDIAISVSDNGGKTYQINSDNIKGDIGKGINGGQDKIIIWDVLSDYPSFSKKDLIVKVTAKPEKIKNHSDNVEGFYFELTDIRKIDKGFGCKLKVTNKGKSRELQLTNRLIRLYDFNDRKLEANSVDLGRIKTIDRHAKPRLKIQENQTVLVTCRFPVNPKFSKRIKMLELGVEVLDITYGLDMKTGNIQFRDLSLDQNKEQAIAEAISNPVSIDLSKDRSINDNNAPKIEIISPALHKTNIVTVTNENIPLKGSVTDASEIFEVLVNGMEVKLDKNGYFTTDVYLAEGVNNIFLKASDKHDNIMEETYPIIYQSQRIKEQRQSEIQKQKDKIAEERQNKKGEYYALIIGVNEYPDPNIINLDNPVKDSKKLHTTLTEQYTFKPENVIMLSNPTREQIISEFDKLNRSVTENDNLLVFYAGHGYWDDSDQMGYWLPSDAKKENTANWLRNSTIRDYLRSVDTKHTLLIADACFSGGIFKTRKAFHDAPKSIEKLYELPSRKAMTSGTLKEVPDQSVFLLYLNKRLTDNTQKYISAEELFSSFKIAVLNNSPNIPQYGEIKDTGDEGGDFVFIKKE